jgi:putative ABC transport system permease protein
VLPLRYHVRSLNARRSATLNASFAIALVVFVFSSLMMLANGVGRTLASSGGALNALLLSKGASLEQRSSISEADISLVSSLDTFREHVRGAVAAELVTTLPILLVANQPTFNVALRGTSVSALALRPKVRLVWGRWPREGSEEIVLGKNIVRSLERRRFAVKNDALLTESLGHSFRIVGVFSAQESAFENEAWADFSIVRTMFGRAGVASTLLVGLDSESVFARLQAEIDAERRLSLTVKSEAEYYADQSRELTLLTQSTAFVLAILFSIGAVLGATTTMYSLINGRVREIGTLRALGFEQGTILVSFLFESMVLAAVGSLVGVCAALALTGVTLEAPSQFSDTMTSFRFEPSLDIFLIVSALALFLGVASGVWPALWASRVSPVEAMRG